MHHVGLTSTNASVGGVWMAYHFDGSVCVPFCTEVEALRHAVANSMHVRYARYGDEDWLHGEPKKPVTIAVPGCR